MYHPQVISQRVRQLEDALSADGIGIDLRTYSIAEVDELLDSLADAYDSRGNPVRALLDREQAFIANEVYLTKVDFAYWCERYAWINTQGVAVERAYPLWESQRLILAELARLEYETEIAGTRDDGLLALILKARQLGASTLAQLLMAHRATTRTNVFGLTASATPDRSSYLFGMFLRCLDKLPPFLLPDVDTCRRTFPDEIKLATGTNLWAAAGKSTAGMSKDKSDRGSRGQIGRGMTLSLVHISEVSTWDNPAQLSSSLMPAVPEPEPRVLVLYESTAKGTNSYWQRLWNLAKAQRSRFVPIFIPWYAEVTKYRRRPPIGWIPTPATVSYTDRVQERSPRWMNGRSHTLTPEQMYWYETTRAAFEAEHDLETFLEEYPADDEEAFQAASAAAVPAAILDKILDQARPMVGLVEIAPAYELQALHPEEWRPVIK